MNMMIEEKDALRPPEKLQVSEWCDRHQLLLPETSREPGPYRWRRTPYVKDILDVFADPRVRHIVLKTGTQLGKTACLYNLLAYTIAQDPWPTMLIYPTEAEAATVSRTRIQPMIRGVPALAARMPESQKLFHLQEMLLPNMPLYITGANSATPLSQKPVKILLRDEVNKFPALIKDMGDPLDLSEERLKSFWDIRKVVDVSSPTSEDGNISRQEQKMQVVLSYFVPCPACGRLQTLRWPNIKFDDHKDYPKNKRIFAAKASAYYECRFCAAKIEDHLKEWMLLPESGAGWYPFDIEEPAPSTDPIGDLFKRFEEEGITLERIGFRLSSLYSPWLTWGDIVEKFLSAHLAEFQRPDKLRGFINDWLGEEWKDVVTHKEEDAILSHRLEDLPPLTVPAEAAVLTCGIDCQRDSFFFTVRAWSLNGTSWLIRYGSLLSWDDVRQLLLEDTYSIQNSEKRMGLWRAAIDIGGTKFEDMDQSMTAAAYSFISGLGIGGVFGAKGMSRDSIKKVEVRVVNSVPGKSNIPLPGGGLRLLLVDTNYFKDILHARLEIKTGDPGAWHLHSETASDYSRQIVAEEKRRDSRGKTSWVHVRGRNEYLDAEVYAMALTDPGCFGGINTLSKRPATVSATPSSPPAPGQRADPALAGWSSWREHAQRQRPPDGYRNPSWLRERRGD